MVEVEVIHVSLAFLSFSFVRSFILYPPPYPALLLLLHSPDLEEDYM